MFTLKPLPFAKNSLEPHMSEKTLEFHYGKHHQTYIDNLNKLVANTELEALSLEEIIVKTAGKLEQAAIFNNAAQSYNHEFFWNCLSAKPEDRAIPAGLSKMIIETFGSLDGFYEQFKAAALGQFGSGWAWLVQSDKGLGILKTANGDNPLTHNLKPILGLDIWEHSYYLDYQNRRGDFVDAVMKNLFNWGFAAKNIL